ncbi:MAG: hypothetical protein AAFV53_21515 [Myxococcota bacterium]
MSAPVIRGSVMAMFLGAVGGGVAVATIWWLAHSTMHPPPYASTTVHAVFAASGLGFVNLVRTPADADGRWIPAYLLVLGGPLLFLACMPVLEMSYLWLIEEGTRVFDGWVRDVSLTSDLVEAMGMWVLILFPLLLVTLLIDGLLFIITFPFYALDHPMFLLVGVLCLAQDVVLFFIGGRILHGFGEWIRIRMYPDLEA